jgi:hypothetical protein
MICLWTHSLVKSCIMTLSITILKHNDTHHIESRHIGIQHNSTQNNGHQHNAYQLKTLSIIECLLQTEYYLFYIFAAILIITMLSVIMLSFLIQCPYAGCYEIGCHYAGRCYTECHGAPLTCYSQSSKVTTFH